MGNWKRKGTVWQCVIVLSMACLHLGIFRAIFAFCATGVPQNVAITRKIPMDVVLGEEACNCQLLGSIRRLLLASKHLIVRPNKTAVAAKADLSEFIFPLASIVPAKFTEWIALGQFHYVCFSLTISLAEAYCIFMWCIL